MASAPAPTVSTSAPAPRAVASAPTPTISAPAPAAASGGADFSSVLTAAKSNTPAVQLGDMIDKIRTQLSKENPLNPILFELSMESGRLKALGNTPLQPNHLKTLEEKIVKWK